VIKIAPLTKISSVAGEDLDPVVLPVANQNPAINCDPYAVRRGKLPRTAANAAPTAAIAAVRCKPMDMGVAVAV
jgi:hypothetical protein